MKTQQIIRQYMVLSFLMIYQVIGIIHLAYLPKLRYDGATRQSTSDFLHKNRGNNVPRAQYQRSFHSTDNSRKRLTIPGRVLVLFFAFFLTGIAALVTAKNPSGFFGGIKYVARPSYLTLRTLRI